MRFEASGALTLVVRDGDLPLSGASVRLQVGPTPYNHAVTDGRAQTYFAPLGEGAFKLVLTREACWPVELDVALGAGEQAEPTVQMRRLADLELAVVRQAGLPVACLPVEIRSLKFDVGVQAWLKEGRIRSEGGLTTNAQGEVRVQGLPRGPYSWTATVPGTVANGTFELEPGAPAPLRITLPRRQRRPAALRMRGTPRMTTFDPAQELAAFQALQDELDELNRLPPATLARVVPAVQGWSAEQQLAHVVLRNLASLASGKGALIVWGAETNPVALRVLGSGRIPRGDAQAPRIVRPPERIERELLGQWLADPHTALARLDPSALRPGDPKITHQVLGPPDGPLWARFAVVHTRHHLAIAREVLAAV